MYGNYGPSIGKRRNPANFMQVRTRGGKGTRGRTRVHAVKGRHRRLKR